MLGPWREPRRARRARRRPLGRDARARARADLAWLQPLALERFFDVPEPRLRVLEALPYQLYAAKVVEER